mgnify:CR=1 FL=1
MKVIEGFRTAVPRGRTWNKKDLQHRGLSHKKTLLRLLAVVCLGSFFCDHGIGMREERSLKEKGEKVFARPTSLSVALLFT